MQQFRLFCRNQKPHNETVITLKSPKPPLVLGAPPRLAYPLVVFLIRENETDDIPHPDETVSSMINDAIPIESEIIFAMSFLLAKKFKNNTKIHKLQPLGNR